MLNINNMEGFAFALKTASAEQKGERNFEIV
jgi:hypothetical protein